MIKRARSKRRSGLTLLALMSVMVAATCAAGGILILNIGYPNDTPTEVGKWLLQISALFAGTGALSAALRQADVARVERASWAALLQDLIAAHDLAQLSSRLLSAHATAKTYSEQMTQIHEVRANIRRLSSAPEVHDDPSLSTPLLAMRRYLRLLVEEYRDKYLAIARQQRLDEAALTYRLKEMVEAAATGEFPVLPDDLAGPLPAGVMLADASKFPRLADFRDNYDQCAFRANYEEAKDAFQARAGIRR
jgi:hypothetical protein